MVKERYDWFLALVQEGSFTRAAERLFVTQQTLSARLAALEADFGCKLMERTSPLRLTRAGEEFRIFAEQESAQMVELQRRLGDIAAGTGGVIRVSVAHTRGRYVLPKAMRVFAKAHPNVEVRVFEVSNDAAVDMLYAGEADVAIARFPESRPGLTTVDLYDESVVLVVPKPLLETMAKDARKKVFSGDLRPLADTPFLMCQHGDIARRVGLAALAKAGIKPRVSLCSGNVETLLDACAMGLGVAFCPDVLVDFRRDTGCELVSIPLGKDATYSVSAAYLSSTSTWQALEDFIEALRG